MNARVPHAQTSASISKSMPAGRLLDLINDHSAQLKVVWAEHEKLRAEHRALRRCLGNARVITAEAFEEELQKEPHSGPTSADFAAGISTDILGLAHSGAATAPKLRNPSPARRSVISPTSTATMLTTPASASVPARPTTPKRPAVASAVAVAAPASAASAASTASAAVQRRPSSASARRGSTVGAAGERVPSAKRGSCGSAAALPKASTVTAGSTRPKAPHLSRAKSAPRFGQVPTTGSSERTPSTERRTSLASERASSAEGRRGSGASERPRSADGRRSSRSSSPVSSPLRERTLKPAPRDLFEAAQPLLAKECLPEHRSRAIADVQALLESGVSPHGWKGLETPLRVAVQAHRTELLRLILMAKGNPDESDNKGVSILHMAAFDGQVEHCGILLDASADANIMDQHGQTPLFFAPIRGVCEALYHHRADVNIINQKGQSALHLAGRAGLADVLTWLGSRVDKHVLELRDMHGATAAYYARHAGVPPEALIQNRLMPSDRGRLGSNGSISRSDWLDGSFGIGGPLPPVLEIPEAEEATPAPSASPTMEEVASPGVRGSCDVAASASLPSSAGASPAAAPSAPPASQPSDLSRSHGPAPAPGAHAAAEPASPAASASRVLCEVEVAERGLSGTNAALDWNSSYRAAAMHADETAKAECLVPSAEAITGGATPLAPKPPRPPEQDLPSDTDLQTIGAALAGMPAQQQCQQHQLVQQQQQQQ
eukprot:CAMPEP_0115370022 /NCGR_PEP_ID=MMETSP0270-20121206/106621_1 /TAXON_ID=71861 /ORGANISM="Scrippsiella trochoidea, Strain CCMP3099" /LENGTH=720 /DNA_ID=CAMNT_0002792841 /DNA_START=11 /DNA_END=2170 /DNA_ORIENTATION=+